MLSGNNLLRSILLLLVIVNAEAQELYPLSEPASSVPKGVFGLRALSEQYKDADQLRTMQYIRFMHGVTARLSVYVTAAFSNHHDRKLSPNLINHIHQGTQTNYFTQNTTRGVEYPYLFNGLNLYAKYRFISHDAQNRHFRMAVYGQWSGVYTPHDEAEPDLTDDTGGYGHGLITTWLNKRFAASLTVGRIRPDSYFEMQPDRTGGPDLATRITYPRTTAWSLSFGYLLYPKSYTSYDEPNWNLYLEFLGKSFGAAKIVQGNSVVVNTNAALAEGSYVSIHPGIQKIIRSNTRIEFIAGFDFIGRSYAQINPQWSLAVQRYFFRE